MQSKEHIHSSPLSHRGLESLTFAATAAFSTGGDDEVEVCSGSLNCRDFGLMWCCGCLMELGRMLIAWW